MPDLTQGLKAVVESSTSMITWALAVGAGSVATIVSTSYFRPQQRWARIFYLLFPIGWLFLALSIYYGNSIARGGVAAQLVHEDLLVEIGAEMNTAYIHQQWTFGVGLIAFAAWLLLYLLWWIYVQDVPKEK